MSITGTSAAMSVITAATVTGSSMKIRVIVIACSYLSGRSRCLIYEQKACFTGDETATVGETPYQHRPHRSEMHQYDLLRRAENMARVIAHWAMEKCITLLYTP